MSKSIDPQKIFGGRVCIVRTTDAGVHVGMVAEIDRDLVYITDSRRIWSWEGAFSLSELANDGVASDSKIANSTPENILKWIEILPISPRSAVAISRCGNGMPS